MRAAAILLAFALTACASEPESTQYAPHPPVYAERPGVAAPDLIATERLLFGPYDVQADSGVTIARR